MSTTLWVNKENASQELSEQVHAFTSGNDAVLDIRLAAVDVKGSLAHVTMLGEVGLLSAEDVIALKHGLAEILETIQAGTFCIEQGVEDVHSQVELLLTRKLGDAGKRLHTGRSRNDQVLTDLKLYFKEELLAIVSQLTTLFGKFQNASEQHKHRLMPGYTHMQIAMPSSFGLWLGAYAEALCDDLEVLAGAYAICDANPLGSGAGYGGPFALNRERTTELMGFTYLNVNSVYAQMSRGKTEKIVGTALANLAATISRFAADCVLFLSQNFGFISFPPALSTGSSIMPHKQNPDVFELIRARCARIQAVPNELSLLMNNLNTGYHRDFQLSKEIIFPAIDSLKACISMTELMLEHMEVKADLLENSMYQPVYSVEAIHALVEKGVPFREAYQKVAREPQAYLQEAAENLAHTHVGSIHNLRNDLIKKRFEEVCKKF